MILSGVWQDDDDSPNQSVFILAHDSDDERPSKRSRLQDNFPKFVLPSEREGSRAKTPPKVEHRYQPTVQELEDAQRKAEARRQQSVQAIIAAAAKAAEEAAAKPKPPPVPEVRTSKSHGRDVSGRESRKKSSGSSSKPKQKKLSKEEKEANKEKRLLKLIGAVVVKCMSKYKDQLDHDQFKKYAKEVCCLRLVSSHANAALTSNFLAAHARHRGEGEEIVKLQGRQAGRAVRREGGQDQEILQGVYSEGPPQAGEIGQTAQACVHGRVILHAR